MSRTFSKTALISLTVSGLVFSIPVGIMPPVSAKAPADRTRTVTLASGNRLLFYAPPADKQAKKQMPATGEGRPKDWLVLVHGITPNTNRLYGWQPFLKAMETRPDFYARYQTVLFVFDSRRPRRENTAAFRMALRYLLARQGGESDKTAPRTDEKPGIRIAALSLGGLLAKDSLSDPELAAGVEQVITLGTPFHGTPLANPAWMREQLRTERPWHPLRWGNRIVYGITRHKFPHFESDYAWDNFDGSMPRHLPPQTGAMRESLTAFEAPTVGFEPRFPAVITYGGFFKTDPDTTRSLMDFLGTADLPRIQERKAFYRGFLPDRHAMIAFVSKNIGKIPVSETLAASASPEGNGIHPSLLAYNDGVCPISSHLWLGRFMNAAEKRDREAVWDALRQLRQGGQARLFEGIDHRDWLEGTTRTGQTAVTDLLHPKEGAKTVFEWLYADLMQTGAAQAF